MSQRAFRVAVVGATGNVGTSVVRALVDDDRVEGIVGLARRLPPVVVPRVEWRTADIRWDDLTEHFRGCDAVVHLAWLIQPARDEQLMRDVNVLGTDRVLEAVVEAGVRNLVYASSVGAYSRGPKDRAVDESWPTDGVPTSYYGRHKASVERMLDRFEGAHPEVRVVRLRKALVFKRGAASEIRRYFMGTRIPKRVVDETFIPLVPRVDRLVFQAVHSDDVGEAYRLALHSDVRGAFNIAADPVLGPRELAQLLHARSVTTPRALVRLGADLAYRARLVAASPGWVDLAFAVPVMDTTRARRELGWVPKISAEDALVEVLHGIRDGAGMDTPPLEPEAGPAVAIA